MVDPKYLVTAIVVIPLFLLLGTTVFHNMAVNSRTPFETSVANESLGNCTTTKTVYPAYAVKNDNDTLEIWNGTGSTWQRFSNFTISYEYEIDRSQIVLGGNCIQNANISYTAYSGDGYESFAEVYDQTLEGQQLGAIFPYIIIAMAIIGAIIGAFGLTKII